MELMRPSNWDEALEMKARHPEALPIAGGTDVMVELNFGRRRPEAIIDLGRIAALREHGQHP
jgi:CO/xanthine dehydrogenase FAD-binding subunit